MMDKIYSAMYLGIFVAVLWTAYNVYQIRVTIEVMVM